MKNTAHEYRRVGEVIGVFRDNEQIGVINTPRAKAALSELLVTLGNTLVLKPDK